MIHRSCLFLSLFGLSVLVVSSEDTSLHITHHTSTHRTTTSVGRVLRELDVLLRVHMDHERRRVHQLMTHTNVSLLDQHTSVMDRLRKTQLEHLRLQSAVHQLRSRQLQNHIQLHLLLRHKSQTGHATNDSSSLENATRIILRQSQQFSSSLQTHRNNTTNTLRIFASTNCTRQISRLQRRPYSPQIRSSWSKRSRSKGRRGVENVRLSKDRLEYKNLVSKYSVFRTQLKRLRHHSIR